ncbi:MAG: hypothetical protein UR46_C0018G0007 [Parcubacteria group bacterium GW2011_GWA1_33_6]|nr:MAG: hypothetical protein UR46_C0018G0007 [Parcubacteria group bacterium GW2011_GWA1_33_6]
MNIRKILSFFILLIVLLMPLAPQLVSAAALVPCGSLLLIFGSWLIINVLLTAIGYTGAWHTF